MKKENNEPEEFISKDLYSGYRHLDCICAPWFSEHKYNYSKIKELMDKYEEGKDFMIGLVIYSDDSGHVFKSFPSKQNILFEFSSIDELKEKLKK